MLGFSLSAKHSSKREEDVLELVGESRVDFSSKQHWIYVWLLVIVYFHFGFLFLDVARVCISGFCMQPGKKGGRK